MAFVLKKKKKKFEKCLFCRGVLRWEGSEGKEARVFGGGEGKLGLVLFFSFP